MKAGQKINMKYLIIGAGGTGGVTGYYMKKAGKDVTLIARGEHLKKIQKQGLTSVSYTHLTLPTNSRV